MRLFSKFLTKTKQKQNTKNFLKTTLTDSGNLGFLHHNSKNNFKCKIWQFFPSESFVNLPCCFSSVLSCHYPSFFTPPAASLLISNVVLQNALSVLSFIFSYLPVSLGTHPDPKWLTKTSLKQCSCYKENFGVWF